MERRAYSHDPERLGKTLELSGLTIMVLGFISALAAETVDKTAYDRLYYQEKDLSKTWILTLSEVEQRELGAAAAETLLSPARYAEQQHPTISKFQEAKKQYMNTASPNFTEEFDNASKTYTLKLLGGTFGMVLGILVGLSGSTTKEAARREGSAIVGARVHS